MHADFWLFVGLYVTTTQRTTTKTTLMKPKRKKKRIAGLSSLVHCTVYVLTSHTMMDGIPYYNMLLQVYVCAHMVNSNLREKKLETRWWMRITSEEQKILIQINWEAKTERQRCEEIRFLHTEKYLSWFHVMASNCLKTSNAMKNSKPNLNSSIGSYNVEHSDFTAVLSLVKCFSLCVHSTCKSWLQLEEALNE